MLQREYFCCEKIVNPEIFDNKRILVLGASGLIGSSIIYTLLYWSLEHAVSIRIVAGGRSINRLNSLYGEVPNIDCFAIDVMQMFPEIGDFDFIINAASPADPASFSDRPAEVLLSNVVGVSNIAKYACQHGNPVIVHISSGEVYGFFSQDHKVTEEEQGFLPFLDTRACYPMGKRAAETLCISLCAEKNLDIRIARPSHVFGPGFSPRDSRISADFFRTTLKNSNIVLHSPGTQKRTYIFSGDCASGILSIAAAGCAGQIYNVTNSSNVTTVYAFARQIAQKHGLSVDIQIQHSVDNTTPEKLYRVAQLDDRKLRSLGWGPIVGLGEGIDKTFMALEQEYMSLDGHIF